MDRTPAAIRRHMGVLAERCRRAGMNVTPQRMAVYKALLESAEHPTPEVLYRKVRRSMPFLSLATIYKALDALESLGLAQVVEVDSASRRYDANMNRHHHLICTQCRKVIDFYDETLNEVKPTRSVRGFVAETVAVKVFGLCETCAARR